jgi:hypothetical protein
MENRLFKLFEVSVNRASAESISLFNWLKSFGTIGNKEVANTTTHTLDLSKGNFIELTLNSSTSLTIINPEIGPVIIKLVQGVGGTKTVTWPSTIKWPEANQPNLSNTQGSWDIITLLWDGTYYSATSTINFTV